MPEPLVMRSSGGVATVDEAAAHPALVLVSGPAAGAVGAARVAAEAGFPNAIAFDMGGTSTDVCLIVDGVAERSSERLVAGLPIRLPTIDIHTVGAGGGSIARVDAGGAVRVGPESAGAEPGPACYGRGGTLPTVTDANLLLGRLPERARGRGGARSRGGRARARLARPRGGRRGRERGDAARAARRLGRARPRPARLRARRVRRRRPAARVRARRGARDPNGARPRVGGRALRARPRRERRAARPRREQAGAARRGRRAAAGRRGRPALRRPVLRADDSRCSRTSPPRSTARTTSATATPTARARSSSSRSARPTCGAARRSSSRGRSRSPCGDLPCSSSPAPPSLFPPGGWGLGMGLARSR